MKTRRGFMRGIMAAVAGAIGVPLMPTKPAGTTKFLREDAVLAPLMTTGEFLIGDGKWSIVTKGNVFFGTPTGQLAQPVFRTLAADDLPKQRLDSRSAPAT